MFRLIAVLSLMPTVALAADPAPQPKELGQVVSPVRIALTDNGSVDLHLDSPIILDNGRVYEQKDGVWNEITPASVPSPENIAPVDLVAYWGRYANHRIGLQQVTIFEVDAAAAYARLPGGFARFSVLNLQPDTLKYLLVHCSSIMPAPGCEFDLAGIADKKDGTEFDLKAVSLQRSNASKPASAKP